MAIKVVCECGAKFAAREELAGKTIECTACGKKVEVPSAAPAAASGGGKGLIVTMLVVLTAAVAGAGYMIHTQQERIADLQGTMDSLDGMLSAAAQRIDGLKEELAANAKADAELSAGRLVDKDALAAMQKDLASETDRRKTLVQDLDRLDTDALRIRSEIEQAEKARDDAWEKISQANRDKQMEYDGQLGKLREDLATKADDLATRDKIAAEVQRIEAAKDALTDQANKDRAQLQGYETKIDGLRNQLQAKSVKQTQLQTDLDLAQTKLNNLQQTVQKKPLQNQLQTLQTKVDQNLAERFQTLAFDDPARGESMWFKVDTSSGRVTYKIGLYKSIIAGGPSFGGWGQQQAPGRYALRVAARSNGNINDVVLLDTDSGRLWSCEIGRNSARNLTWNYVPVLSGSAFGQPGAKGKWRISVSPNGGAAQPLLVVTGPNGWVYDDAIAHRVLLFPTGY